MHFCQTKLIQCGRLRMLIFFPLQLENTTGFEYSTQRVRGQTKSKAPYDFSI